MLYGLSLLYGFTGTLDIHSPQFSAGLLSAGIFPLFIALFMSFAGLLFKMAVVPFHVWTPDVYEGAPVSLIAFFSIVPKLAGLVIFARIFYLIKGIGVPFDWTGLFGVLALATMFLGNLAAIWQSDAKRMMAYSSIAHSGYLMVGILAMNTLGLQAVVIHSLIYLLMNFLVFMMIELLVPVTGGTNLAGYSGGFRYVPLPAILFLIGFISLVGIPPAGGFTSKLMLFSSAWYAYATGGEKIMLWLLVLGLLNTLISLFYYLRIPFYMAFREPDKGWNITKNLHPGFLGLGILLGLLIIMAFIKPDWLVDILNRLNFAYLGIIE
jgi:NADH-quinone oxidoreductase subunit N